MSERICCDKSLELPQKGEAILMGTHNICFYIKLDKKSTRAVL